MILKEQDKVRMTDDFNFFNLLFGKKKLNNVDTLAIDQNSIFNSDFIKPKEIVESSGSRVKIVDVVSEINYLHFKKIYYI